MQMWCNGTSAYAVQFRANQSKPRLPLDCRGLNTRYTRLSDFVSLVLGQVAQSLLVLSIASAMRVQIFAYGVKVHYETKLTTKTS